MNFWLKVAMGPVAKELISVLHFSMIYSFERMVLIVMRNREKGISKGICG